MFKMIATLVRGRTHDAVEVFADANAMSILRQQLRDAAQGMDSAKRAVAVVMAYAEREKTQVARINGQLTELEARAIAALEKGRDDLAQEAAGAIAELEVERAASEKAIAHYTAEISRLREQVSLAEQRLRILQRGRQLADAAAKTQRLRGTMPDGVMASLAEAEATLERMQERQHLAEATEIALTTLSSGLSATATSTRLAAAGCGAPLRPDAAEVLNRLRAKAAT